MFAIFFVSRRLHPNSLTMSSTLIVPVRHIDMLLTINSVALLFLSCILPKGFCKKQAAAKIKQGWAHFTLFPIVKSSYRTSTSKGYLFTKASRYHGQS
jgi:hypothetical protein